MGVLFPDEVEGKLTFCGTHSHITIPYTPIAKVRGGLFIHVKGVVVYFSGLENWSNHFGCGKKMCFDLADETAIIRIFAWHEAAEEVAKLIKIGQTIGLMNMAVGRKRAQFNNLDHPYELEFEDDTSQIVLLKRNSIQAIEDIPHFLPFELVRECSPNEYFSVSGKVVDIGLMEEGVGHDRGAEYTRRFIYIKDEGGDRLKIVSWNEHIPILSKKGVPILKVGKILSVIRGKWIREWDNVNSSDAKIEINGKRVR